jgi:hypothetical protein
VVNDRKLPIARIVPLHRSAAINDEAAVLAAEGKLRLPERRLPASFWRMRAPKVEKARLLKALRAERERLRLARSGTPARWHCFAADSAGLPRSPSRPLNRDPREHGKPGRSCVFDFRIFVRIQRTLPDLLIFL